MPAAVKDRYSGLAIVLHWLIALSIFTLIGVGWWMTDAIEDPDTRMQAFKVYQIHKSAGLTVLVLSVVQIVWRLINPPPPLPAHMPGWEKVAARAAHVLLYVIMIAIPLAGWAYVSAGWSLENDRPFSIPTLWFGLFEVPHLPGFESLNDDAREAAAETTMFAHEKLAWAAIILGGLHIAAALKHHLVDKDSVLTHMLPFLKPLGPQR